MSPKIWLYDFFGIQLPYFIDMAVRLFGYDCSVLGYACRLTLCMRVMGLLGIAAVIFGYGCEALWI